MTSPADEAVTADALLGGRVRLYQPSRGARMSLDPVLLAGFVAAPYGRFLDIGLGTGALAFLLLARDPGASGVGVELQPQLAALARRGRDENGWEERLEILVGDTRARVAGIPAARFDLVATNPPYRPLDQGNVSPDQERALAHHEVELTLLEWVEVAARAVRPGGRVAAIFPAERSFELGEALAGRGLRPLRLRFVHAQVDRPASRLLVEAERGGRGRLTVEPPLVVHTAESRFTPEVLAMLGGGPA